MSNVASLPILLKELKLASFAKHWESLAQKAVDEQWNLPHTWPNCAIRKPENVIKSVCSGICEKPGYLR